MWGICPLSSMIKGVPYRTCTVVSPLLLLQVFIKHEFLVSVCPIHLFIFVHFSIRMKPPVFY